MKVRQDPPAPPGYNGKQGGERFRTILKYSTATDMAMNGNRPSEFMGEFKTSRAVAIQSDTEQAMASEIACPRCKTGHLTVRKNESTNRYFVGCSHYPQCDYTVNDTSVMNEPKHCPRCGGFMVKRKGRYGTFYGCTNYPRCNYTERQENYRKPE